MTNPAGMRRLQSVDALRGLVMIIMALDHVRDFFHSAAMSFQPEDLTRTTAALFFTRWVTHICAPVFAFTAGIGAFLWCSRGRTPSQLSAFLWKRGLWLVLLDLVAIRFAMFFSLTSGPIILSVLWVLGWSMVILGFLVRLPLRLVAAGSIGVILLHNLADGVPASVFGSAGWIWNVLHQPGLLQPGGVAVLTAYPLVPWFAVVAAGFAFGPVAQMDAAGRRGLLFRVGIALTAAFAALRLLNGYGDPRPWSVQQDPVMTVLSFLNTTKYPPSLMFLLMTLGPAMLVWHWLEGVRLKNWNPLLVFGRVPLFYFVLHLYLIHALTFVFAYGRYGTTGFLHNPLPSLGGSRDMYPPGYGYDLAVVYIVWLAVTGTMYFPCVWLARLKERRAHPWLSYV
jgi:uncharacterized membrane protein